MSNDERFASALNAPIFKKSKSNQKKIKLDDRFKSVLTDERFRSVPGQVDIHGKKKKSKKSSNIDELSKFYDVEDPEDRDDETKPVKNEKPLKPANKTEKIDDRLDYLNKLARGEISGDSSSESSSEEDDDELEDDDSVASDDDVSVKKKEQINSSSSTNAKQEEVEEGEATYRLAVKNCDWENLRAQDLMVVMQSFCPSGRSIRSVTVYPSDFGKKQMAIEAQFGPQGIWKTTAEKNLSFEGEEWEEMSGSAEEDEGFSEEEEERVKKGDGDFQRRKGDIGLILQSENDDKDVTNDKNVEKGEIDEIKLRAYELSKLKYYFAIVECDSVETANTLYEQLDQVEFEHSSVVFDLSFVPDDLGFGDREVRDKCDILPTLENYQPPEFIVNALQHSNVECTWDMGEKDRENKLTNFSQWRTLQESELQQYLASSSDSEGEEREEMVSDKGKKKKEKAQNLRKLLLGDTLDDDGLDEDDFFEENKKSDAEDSRNNEDKDGVLEEKELEFYNANQSESEEEESESDQGELDIENTKSDDEDEDDDDLYREREMTFIPEMGLKEKLQQKIGEKKEETPLEVANRISAEKKKARKLAKKAWKEENNNKDILNNAKEVNHEGDEENRKVLELMFGDDGSDDDDVRLKQIQTSFAGAPDKKKKSKKQRLQEKKDKKLNKENELLREDKEIAAKTGGKITEKTGNNEAPIDVSDDRFQLLFSGDARFGIERTAAEFRDTPGMGFILKEQQKRREKKEKGGVKSLAEEQGEVGKKRKSNEGIEGNGEGKMSELALKLKKKFKK